MADQKSAQATAAAVSDTNYNRTILTRASGDRDFDREDVASAPTEALLHRGDLAWQERPEPINLKASFNATGVVLDGAPILPYTEALELNEPHKKDKTQTHEDLLKEQQDPGNDSVSNGRMRRHVAHQAAVSANQKKDRTVMDDILMQQVLDQIAENLRLAQESYNRAREHFAQAEEYMRRADEELARHRAIMKRVRDIEEEIVRSDRSFKDRVRGALGEEQYLRLKDDPAALLAALEDTLLDENGHAIDPDDLLSQYVEGIREADDVDKQRKQNIERAQTEIEQGQEQIRQSQEFEERALRSREKNNMVQARQITDGQGLPETGAAIESRIEQQRQESEHAKAEAAERLRAMITQPAQEIPPIDAAAEIDLDSLGIMASEEEAEKEIASLDVSAADDNFVVPKTITVYESEEAFLQDFSNRTNPAHANSAVPISVAGIVFEDEEISPDTIDLTSVFAKASNNTQQPTTENDIGTNNENVLVQKLPGSHFA